MRVGGKAAWPGGAGSLDALAHALADPSRRGILERLAVTPGATSGELATVAPHLTRFAVLKHLEVLRAAGLVRTMSEGRRRRHFLEAVAMRPLRDWLERLPG